MLMGLTSVAETYRVIKQFHFHPDLGHDAFSELTFSDSSWIGLNTDGYAVRLKRQVGGMYPTADDIYFRTWTTTPKACRQLQMLEIFPEVQPDGAAIQVRINNGTNDLFWDGTEWAIAANDDWNTEAEINANISTFPILPARTFAITVNLISQDGTLVNAGEVTPYVDEIRVLMEVHIDFLEDIVFRSLMPALESGVTALANYTGVLPLTADSDEIDFGNHRINTPYNITGIEQVYDFTVDSDLLYNLYESYNTGTGIITLTDDLPAGHRPWIVFRYVPEIVYITHQDWFEVAKLPTLLLQRLEVPIATSYNATANEGIVDKGTYAAVVIDAPLRMTLQFRLHGLTASAVDEMRLMSRVMSFFKNNEFVTSIGLDEKYRLWLEKEFRDMSNSSKSDERAFWTQFSIKDVRLPFVSRDTTAVRRMIFHYSEPLPAHEDPIKGGRRIVDDRHTNESATSWVRNHVVPDEGD